jgi:choline kinase
MSRFIHQIKGTPRSSPIAILSAGIGSRIKSHEPRALLKVGNVLLLEHQIEVVNKAFSQPDVIVGVGYEPWKIMKRVSESARFVENQLYETSGSFETLRLIVNNTKEENIIFFHGDLYFKQQFFQSFDYSKSFVVCDNTNNMSDKEVGVTENRQKATIFSYGLENKWCQIAFLKSKEMTILRQICQKPSQEMKSLLTFEILNAIINKGGVFNIHYAPENSILEIDSMKDLNNENFNF